MWAPSTWPRDLIEQNGKARLPSLLGWAHPSPPVLGCENSNSPAPGSGTSSPWLLGLQTYTEPHGGLPASLACRRPVLGLLGFQELMPLMNLFIFVSGHPMGAVSGEPWLMQCVFPCSRPWLRPSPAPTGQGSLHSPLPAAL